MNTPQSIILLPYQLSIYTEDLSGDESNAFIGLSSGKTLNSGMRTLNQRVGNLPSLFMVICTFFFSFFFFSYFIMQIKILL